MANLNLVGAIQCELNHVFAITCTEFSINGDRPVTVKFGAQGSIGSAKGFTRPTGSMTFAIPAQGLEFDFIATLDTPGGFTFSFPIGAERHSLYGCLWSKRGIRSTMENGDAVFTIDFAATDWIRTS